MNKTKKAKEIRFEKEAKALQKNLLKRKILFSQKMSIKISNFI